VCETRSLSYIIQSATQQFVLGIVLDRPAVHNETRFHSYPLRLRKTSVRCHSVAFRKNADVEVEKME
jgi:hypothetical protein